jgi:hypothetical protein
MIRLFRDHTVRYTKEIDEDRANNIDIAGGVLSFALGRNIKIKMNDISK